MLFYISWIPYVIGYYVLAAFLSKKLNDAPQSQVWFLSIVFIQILGAWPFVAKYSKNLLFDAVFFDVIIIFAYYITLVALGSGAKFTPVQWFACGMVLFGLLIFKVAG